MFGGPKIRYRFWSSDIIYSILLRIWRGVFHETDCNLVGYRHVLLLYRSPPSKPGKSCVKGDDDIPLMGNYETPNLMSNDTNMKVHAHTSNIVPINASQKDIEVVIRGNGSTRNRYYACIKDAEARAIY